MPLYWHSLGLALLALWHEENPSGWWLPIPRCFWGSAPCQASGPPPCGEHRGPSEETDFGRMCDIELFEFLPHAFLTLLTSFLTLEKIAGSVSLQRFCSSLVGANLRSLAFQQPSSEVFASRAASASFMMHHSCEGPARHHLLFTSPIILLQQL